MTASASCTVYQRRRSVLTGEMRTRYVYFAHAGEPTQLVKIGISIKPHERLKELKCQLLFAVPCEYRFARILEKQLHTQFADTRQKMGHRGYGYTEWFKVNRELSWLIQTVRLTGFWPWDYTRVIR